MKFKFQITVIFKIKFNFRLDKLKVSLRIKIYSILSLDCKKILCDSEIYRDFIIYSRLFKFYPSFQKATKKVSEKYKAQEMQEDNQVFDLKY